MAENTFFSFDPIAGAPANNRIITSVGSIASFRVNTATDRFWITLSSGEEFELNQADWDLLRSRIDANG